MNPLRIRWFVVLVLVSVVALFAAACGGSTGETTSSGPGENRNATSTSISQTSFTITTQDITFATERITLKSGIPVHLVLDNQGALEHDFTAPGLNVTDDIVQPDDGDHGTGHSMGTMEAGTVHLAAPAGQSESVTFTPRAGTYTFYCSVPGHREAGMTGTIVVE
jgi:uncharacterized cupredoxin-like copper-binding protein